MVPKSGHVTIMDIENLHIKTHIEKFTDSKNAILDLRRKNDEVIAEKTVSEQWRHQALVNAWPSWIDARRQYMFLLFYYYYYYYYTVYIAR